jgi:uroporphyrinogen decarboxylase
LTEVDTDNIDTYPWPDPYAPQILQNVRNKAIQMQRETQAALIVGRTFGNGIFTMGSWLEGFENWFVDLLQDPKRACKIMDKILDLKIQYWDKVLAEVGDLIDVVVEYDDLGSQNGLLISPQLYRKYVKPRQKKLFSFIKKKAPVSLFFHTDGAVYDIIPDFIEVGVDILNPMQFTLAKMDAKTLKKAFGDSLTFCGGGIDTQHTLPFSSPQQVKDEVRRQIDILAPEGGFIFATVHAVQADVPPENFISMGEALQEYGIYMST